MPLRKFCWWDDNVDAVVVVDSTTHTTEIKPAVGQEKRETVRGVFLLFKFFAFQYLLCIFGCCLSLEVLANEAYETVFLLCDKCKNWNCNTLGHDPVFPTPSPYLPLLRLRISLLLSTFIVVAKVKCQLKLKCGWAEWGSGLPLTSCSPTLWICKANL